MVFNPYRFVRISSPIPLTANCSSDSEFFSVSATPSAKVISFTPCSFRIITISSINRAVVRTPYLGKFTPSYHVTKFGLINTFESAEISPSPPASSIACFNDSDGFSYFTTATLYMSILLIKIQLVFETINNQRYLSLYALKTVKQIMQPTTNHPHSGKIK